ncbi:MAG: efflux transporter periplasmic adaptor subunit, partial [Methylocystis sp.]
MCRFHFAPTALFAALALSSGVKAGEVTIRVAPVEDLKAVVASVEPAHQLTARARIGGTVSALKIKEGDDVAGG